MNTPISSRLAPLEQKIGYAFKEVNLLHLALTHSSFSAERNVQSYERVEFLGDTVLGMVISEYLYIHFCDETEGDLSRRRSALVCGRTLAEIAESIDLGDFIQISENEELNGGRQNSTILEDVIEALIGAVFLDGGYEAAKQVIYRLFVPLVDKYTCPPIDAKTALQEWSQQHGLPIPHYEVVKQSGPSHAPTFEMRVSVKDHGSAVGEGTNKRKAEHIAAAILFDRIKGIS